MRSVPRPRRWGFLIAIRATHQSKVLEPGRAAVEMNLRRKHQDRYQGHDQTNRRFRTALEQESRRVVSAAQRADEDDAITSSLTQEMALVLDHLDHLRDVHADLEHRLLQSECYIDTELMQMEARTPRYSPSRFPEREKLQRRLMGVEQERRRLIQQKEESLQRLHDRLLSLLNRQRHLAP